MESVALGFREGRSATMSVGGTEVPAPGQVRLNRPEHRGEARAEPVPAHPHSHP